MKLLFSVCLFFTGLMVQGQLIFPSQPGLTVVQHKPQPDTPAHDTTQIYWTERRLTWNDYKKIQDTVVRRKVGKTNIRAKAATTLAMFTNFKTIGNRFFFEAHAIFFTKESWVLSASVNDSALMKHEQLHFDIAELYARKIRKSLAEYPNPKQNEKAMHARIDSLKEAQNKENRKYDIESVHSVNKVMQKKWEARIKKELEELKTFARPRGVRIV